MKTNAAKDKKKKEKHTKPKYCIVSGLDMMLNTPFDPIRPTATCDYCEQEFNNEYFQSRFCPKCCKDDPKLRYSIL